MRLAKFFASILILTIISLSYVHLSFLNIEANYNIKSCEKDLALLLDRNRELMYNISALESPACLLAKLDSCGLEYEMPRQWAVSRRYSGSASYEVANVVKRRNAVFERIVGIVSADQKVRSFGN